MSKRHRKVSSARLEVRAPNPSNLPHATWSNCVAYVIIISVGLFAVHRLWQAHPPTEGSQSEVQTEFPTLARLLHTNPANLIKVDVGAMNLCCAEGLPGAENMNLQKSLITLDNWASRVRENTQRHLYRVTDPQYADHYHHSEVYFRCELLLQTLQEDCGAHYNPALIDAKTGASLEWAFVDSKDFFLHGILESPHAGSCSSMPVLYVAVGRRLGYPLKLVRTANHLFARWDDGVTRLNIEGAGTGFSAFPDDYYKNWPRHLTDQEIAANGYLRSLTPPEDLALFLSLRGHCFSDTGHSQESQIAYAEANHL